jgi:hypothetical protein
MKLKKVAHGKSSAQAMVEFAIALPILLMLLYGILEAGRLLFIYSSIVTASRQAVRYGSATGVGTSGVLRYRDCAGIRAAAQRADFLNSFDDTDIHIFHDDGPDPSNPSTGLNKTEYCTGTIDNTFSPTNSSRIVVEIAGDFFPIIPSLVPFIERSASTSSGPIMGESARTILVSIDIVVTAPPGTFQPSTATFTFTPSPSPSPTRTPTPTATRTPTSAFTNTPSLTPVPPTATLSPTATTPPTATLSPTIIPTGVFGCNAMSLGTIQRSGNSMTLTITNPVASPIEIGDIFIVWNHDKGHQTGSDKTLSLTSVILGSQSWSGSPLPSDGPSVTVDQSPSLYIPNGISTISFTFHQSYDNLDGTEQVLINLASPGCTFIKSPP